MIPIRLSDSADPLATFAPEAGSASGAVPLGPAVAPDTRTDSVVKTAPAAASADRARRRQTYRPLTTLTVAAGLVAIGFIVVASGMFLFRNGGNLWRPTAPVPRPVGHAVLNSRPSGASVLVDGVPRGVTPLEVELAVGVHNVVLQSPTGDRAVTVAVESGTRVIENIDLPTVETTSGGIEVTSEPVGARVLLDGKTVGQTPLSLAGISAGRHVLALSHGGGVVNRSVDVTAGGKVSVFVSLGAGANATGAIVVESSAELRIFENGQLLGLSNSAPLAIAGGRHQFELTNDSLEIRISRSVTIDPGKTVRVSIPAITGNLSVNATPWAEVFVDGKSIGITPMGNVPVAVGSREIVWRHPQFGERRRTVVVGARTPVRVTEDMMR